MTACFIPSSPSLNAAKKASIENVASGIRQKFTGLSTSTENAAIKP
jgi:hypothetical protein